MRENEWEGAYHHGFICGQPLGDICHLSVQSLHELLTDLEEILLA